MMQRSINSATALPAYGSRTCVASSSDDRSIGWGDPGDCRAPARPDASPGRAPKDFDSLAHDTLARGIQSVRLASRLDQSIAHHHQLLQLRIPGSLPATTRRFQRCTSRTIHTDRDDLWQQKSGPLA